MIGRLNDIFKKLVEDVTYRLLFLGTYEYQFVSHGGDALNLEPVSKAFFLPPLTMVPARPGVAGVKATLSKGASVLVTFIDGDPCRPVVFSYTSAGESGFTPQKVFLGKVTAESLTADKLHADDATFSLMPKPPVLYGDMVAGLIASIPPGTPPNSVAGTIVKGSP